MLQATSCAIDTQMGNAEAAIDRLHVSSKEEQGLYYFNKFKN